MGRTNSQHPNANLDKQRTFLERFVSLPFFDDLAAETYGRIRAQLKKAGTPVGPNDLLIAAIAVSQNFILISHNTKEFKRVAELEVEDWEE